MRIFELEGLIASFQLFVCGDFDVSTVQKCHRTQIIVALLLEKIVWAKNNILNFCC